MSEPERMNLHAYMKERFDAQDKTLTNIVDRLETLESGEDKRRGRRELATVTGKVIAVMSAFVAAIVALFGAPSH